MSKRLAERVIELGNNIWAVALASPIDSPIYKEVDEVLPILENAWDKSINELKPWTSHLVIGDLIAEVIQVRLAARERRKAARKAQERQYFTLEARAQLR